MGRSIEKAAAQARVALHPLVALARQAVEVFVSEGCIPSPPSELGDEMAARAGVFVSIKSRGELRGCIGTIEPTRRNVAEETIANAIMAATRDPRFPPVSRTELGQLTYSVDVLAPPEPVVAAAELDPKRYGVIATRGQRRGVLLPDLDGVDTAEEQVTIARRKAGIGPHEPIDLWRFDVHRYT